MSKLSAILFLSLFIISCEKENIHSFKIKTLNEFKYSNTLIDGNETVISKENKTVTTPNEICTIFNMDNEPVSFIVNDSILVFVKQMQSFNIIFSDKMYICNQYVSK